jgi:GT2 family glycosyltransferase
MNNTLFITRELASLHGSSLQIRFHCPGVLLSAELVSDDQIVRLALPLLYFGDSWSCTFDVSGLAAGKYRVRVRPPAGVPLAFGRTIALRYGANLRAGAARTVTGSTIGGEEQSSHVRLIAHGESLVLWIGDRLPGEGDFGPDQQSGEAATRFSVVSSAYQVENYLDEFFESITGQSYPSEAIEIVIVDDGSTDRSASVIRKWQRKHGGKIRYLHQRNGGPASARNAGLGLAKNPWVTFMDADNFVDPNYFQTVHAAIRTYSSALAMISCNVITYEERMRIRIDDHPLRFRFADGEKLVPATRLGRFLQLNASSVFFRRDLIDANDLRFDDRIRPGFEDAHFDARYLLAAGGLSVLFLPSAIHYSRRRANRTSLKQTGPSDPRTYSDQIEFGCLALLREAAKSGPAPRQVQDTVLYSLSWQFRQIVDSPESLDFLTREQRQFYLQILTRIFELIETRTILEYDAYGLPFAHRVGILHLFKKEAPPHHQAVVEQLDQSGLLQIRYWTSRPEIVPAISINGEAAPLSSHETRLIEFLGRPFVREHTATLAAPRDCTLTATLEDRSMLLSRSGGSPAISLRSTEIAARPPRNGIAGT